MDSYRFVSWIQILKNGKKYNCRVYPVYKPPSTFRSAMHLFSKYSVCETPICLPTPGFVTPPGETCRKGVSLKPGRCWNTPALYPEARPVTEHVHDSKLQWIDEVFTGHQTLNHHGSSRIYRSIPPQLDFILGAFGLIINSAIMHPPSPDLNKPHTTRGRSLYS